MRKVPRKAWWAVLLLVAAVVIFTWRFSTLGQTATLRVKVQHSFKAADIAVFIDGQSAYKGKLSATARRRFGIRDIAQGTFSRTLHVPPGRHAVRVQILCPAEDYNAASETFVDLAPQRERMLVVNADRRSLRMAAQTSESSATDSVPSWYHGYFMSLSLTVSGSVVSALFGYLIQQLLAVLRKDKSASPASQP